MHLFPTWLQQVRPGCSLLSVWRALGSSALMEWWWLQKAVWVWPSAVTHRAACQLWAGLQPAGLQGSYHSCQITDNLTPAHTAPLLVLLCFSATHLRWENYPTTQKHKREREKCKWKKRINMLDFVFHVVSALWWSNLCYRWSQIDGHHEWGKD